MLVASSPVGFLNNSVGFCNFGIGIIGLNVFVEMFEFSQVIPPLLVISIIFLFSSIEPSTPDTLATPFVSTTIALERVLKPPKDDFTLIFSPFLLISANFKLAPMGMLGIGVVFFPIYSGLLLSAIKGLV